MDNPQGILDAGFFHMIIGSGPVVFGVLVLLIVLSSASWAITFAKILQFRRSSEQTDEFSHLFWESRNLDRLEDSSRRLSASPLAYLFQAGNRELERVQTDANIVRMGVSSIERALERAELEESWRMERGVTFLATVASAAPFIGLFGTVWGIMNAFHNLSSTTATTLQAVAPGISEALVATAVGLAAAIPAAVAYNYFVVALRHVRESMERFRGEFLTIAHAELRD